MLVKMLKEERLESFLDGNIYMNSAAYFKTLESGDVVRADSHEGAEWATQIKELAVQGENSSSQAQQTCVFGIRNRPVSHRPMYFLRFFNRIKGLRDLSCTERNPRNTQSITGV